MPKVWGVCSRRMCTTDKVPTQYCWHHIHCWSVVI